MAASYITIFHGKLVGSISNSKLSFFRLWKDDVAIFWYVLVCEDNFCLAFTWFVNNSEFQRSFILTNFVSLDDFRASHNVKEFPLDSGNLEITNRFRDNL